MGLSETLVRAKQGLNKMMAELLLVMNIFALFCFTRNMSKFPATSIIIQVHKASYCLCPEMEQSKLFLLMNDYS